jgi:cell division protein FtsB
VDSQSVYNLTSVINTIMMIIMVFGGFFVLKGSIGKAANLAQQSAITAQQSELDTLRSRLDDLKEENSRLQHILQTICAALKSQGIAITIDGEMVHIRNDKGGSTSTRIQEANL